MIELVPMAYRLASELEGKKDGLAGFADPSKATKKTQSASVTGTNATVDEDEEHDAVLYRLETLGYRVGQGMVERFSANRPHFTDPLDAIKFLCKDLWTILFRKQIDNLKTNHRGVFVLTDLQFRPFARMSVVPSEVSSKALAQGGPVMSAKEAAVVRAQPYLWFPCGVIRGALAAMGVNASVQAESNGLPAAVFQIKSLNVKQ